MTSTKKNEGKEPMKILVNERAAGFLRELTDLYLKTHGIAAFPSVQEMLEGMGELKEPEDPEKK